MQFQLLFDIVRRSSNRSGRSILPASVLAAREELQIRRLRQHCPLAPFVPLSRSLWLRRAVPTTCALPASPGEVDAFQPGTAHSRSASLRPVSEVGGLDPATHGLPGRPSLLRPPLMPAGLSQASGTKR